MFHELSAFDVGIAASLISINLLISLVLKLGLEQRLLWASLRTIVQLTLLGFVLERIFTVDHWGLIVLLGCIMTAVAAWSAVGRVEYRLPLMTLSSLLSLFTSSWLIAAITLFAIVGYDGWKSEPTRFVIPFLGLILGNTLNGISLGLDKFADQLQLKRGEIEMILSLGGTRWEAARGSIRTAVRTGMTPIINSMLVVGLVSLPGVMTGQLLSGMEPIQAIKYQIVIMFIIAAGTALGTIGVVLLTYRQVFNHAHQFRYDKIRAK